MRARLPADPRHHTSFSRYQATVCSSPRSKLVRARQPVSRSSLSVEPMWRSTCPSRSSTKTFSTSAPTAASTASATSRTEMSIPVATFTTSPASASMSARDDRLDRLGVVVDVEPVAARVPVAVDRQRLARERLRDEARDHLLRMLARAVVVERADDHDRQPVGDVVRVREPVAARLRRRVRRARVQRVQLVHRRVLGRPVHLARGDEDEALDGRPPDRVEQDLRPLDVRGHELGRALLDRLLDVRLGRGVHDHVDLGDDLRATSSASRMSPCTNESRSWLITSARFSRLPA